MNLTTQILKSTSKTTRLTRAAMTVAVSNYLQLHFFNNQCVNYDTLQLYAIRRRASRYPV